MELRRTAVRKYLKGSYFAQRAAPQCEKMTLRAYGVQNADINPQRGLAN
jgi:hypothetical protein